MQMAKNMTSQKKNIFFIPMKAFINRYESSIREIDKKTAKSYVKLAAKPNPRKPSYLSNSVAPVVSVILKISSLKKELNSINKIITA
ncbi:hypothetical protein PROVALCAL_03638 [Providencia alcalifaciens DSM 30120]|uniref:Uncharacterized protein n=1 Tax=Providencia alcalifaciens DSM 30120 TaxID=520999 RepID=B6XJT0_9GAMM|nr:hypothetical protein PROVALCAL_03638 [Providencia alcalifaciens DSM 30120]